jgi:NADP-dependent 3-hydroxy acid dehydrogenase YdfG
LLAAAPSALVYLGSGAARQAYAHNAAYVASKHGVAGLAGATFLDVATAA